MYYKMLAYICNVIIKQLEIMYTYNEMISEVEKNQKLARVNDVLFYVDSSNCQKWIITELFEGGFIAEDGDNNESLFFFNELQLGWSFSDKTKKQNFLNYRFRYVS